MILTGEIIDNKLSFIHTSIDGTTVSGLEFEKISDTPDVPVKTN